MGSPVLISSSLESENYRRAPPLLNFFKHRFWGSKHQACVTSAFTCSAIMPAPNIVAFLYCSTCVGSTHMHALCVCMKNIGQFVGVVSLFPTWRSLGLNSGHQTLQPAPLPAEHILLAPRHRLKITFCFIFPTQCWCWTQGLPYTRQVPYHWDWLSQLHWKGPLVHWYKKK